MRAWAWMTGGLIVWTVHFLGVYLISSLADVAATADDPAWRMAGLAFSLACVLAAALLLWMSVRRLRLAGDGPTRFSDQLAALGAAVAVIAIIWQSLPTLIGY